MNLQILIDTALADFENFYVNGLKIKTESYGFKLCVYGDNDNARIRIPTDSAYIELETDVDKMYFLFLVGHELAHYINKHNFFSDRSAIDTKGLETWADFFGAIITMAIVILGKNSSKLFSTNIKEDVEAGINIILDSYLKLYPLLQNTDSSDIYEHSSERLITVHSGVTSFLVRFGISAPSASYQKDPQELYFNLALHWALKFAKKITQSHPLYDATHKVDMDEEKLKTLETYTKNIHDIHLQLMGNNAEITAGIHPQLQWILGTDFVRPNIESKAKQFIYDFIHSNSQI